MGLSRFLSALALGLAGLTQPGGAQAQDGASPVVVELFTSQGCSSCPPADRLLHQLAMRDDVIALALHVDYWDYIGWKDTFALPRHTARQKGYARAAGRRMIYTPQMIINGTDHVVGNHPMDVSDLIALHEARQQPVELEVVDSGSGHLVTARAAGAVEGEMRILLVDFEPVATVEILRGENAGQTLNHANIVRGWTELGRWDGAGEYRARIDDDGSAAVLVQAAEFGAILAARQLR
ncbi:MAG: DUF1223 domain-containing protein [Rhodobacteraceae bacterium]|nr:MAG: DUF1223 domain-containing protein [Paracoccaceae bacterium]